MGIFQNRPALRWFAPLALVVAVGGTSLVATTANADPTLAPKTAEQLLVDLQAATVDGLSGTVVQHAELGLPSLPTAGGADTSELTSLLSGDHTLKVWYAGQDKARVAVLDKLAETDVVVNGSEVWTWSSSTREATHRTLPAPATDQQRTPPPGTDLPKTPAEAAQRVLEAVGPTTAVTTDASVTVADRPAYELVLSPKGDQTRSLIGQVRIAVDSVTSVPLRVETLSTDGTTIASVGFTDVSFATPEAEEFRFNPEPGTKVTEKATPVAPQAPTAADRKAAEQKAAQAKADTKVVGEGWTTVVVTKVPADAASGQLAGVVNGLAKVSGSWGSGRLFTGPAFSALLTDDGRLAVGAVGEQLLYDALAK